MPIGAPATAVAGSDLRAVAGLEVGNSKRIGDEVIDHAEKLQTKLLPEIQWRSSRDCS